MQGGEIVVDTREADLASRLPHVHRRQLDVGDVLLSAPAGQVVIERKTWPDLAKSLSDGRYAEQKARMLSGEDRVVYIVEGPLRGWKGCVGDGEAYLLPPHVAHM